MPRKPRLPERRKRKIRDNVAREKEAAYGPDIALKQAEIKGVRRAGRKEAQSIRGASLTAARTVESASAKGLKGPYRRDFVRSRDRLAQSYRRSVPFSTAAARQETREEVAGIHDSIASLESQKRRAILTETESRIRSARSARAEQQQSRRERERERSQDRAERKAAISKAIKEARFLVDEFGPPENRTERDLLARDVAKTEGIDVDVQQARKIVERMFSGRRRSELGQSTSPRVRRDIPFVAR